MLAKASYSIRQFAGVMFATVSCSVRVKECVCLSSGVLGHLSLLEVQTRSRKTQQPSRVKELRAKVEALRIQRDQLKAEVETHQVG